MHAFAFQLLAAFLLGIGSSFHCLAMCGPLAVVVTQQQKSLWQQIPYHTGRVGTYISIGILIALPASKGLSFFSEAVFSQQLVSYFFGALVFLFSLLPFVKRFTEKWGNKFLFQAFQYLRRFVAHSKLNNSPIAKQFVAGALHGLIPCAMVYSAVALAVNGRSVLEIVLTMAYFGLGTSISLVFGNYFIQLIPSAKAKKWVLHSLAVFAGLLMLYRVFQSDGLFLPTQEKAGTVHAGICGG